ncbi:MAG: hypothetical protein AAGN35_23435 [Bacteroidota bacterium]
MRIFRAMLSGVWLALLMGISAALFGQGWVRSFGDNREDNFRAVYPLPSGNLLGAGIIEPPTSLDWDPYFQVIDRQGDGLSSRTFLYPDRQIIHDIDALPGGGFIAGGQTNLIGSTGAEVQFLTRLDANLDTVWVRERNGPGDDARIYTVLALPDTSTLVAGSADFSAGSEQAFIMRYDQNGDPLPVFTVFGGSGADFFTDMVRLPSGNVILVGRSDSTGTTFDILLVRADIQGNLLNTYKISTPDREYGNAVHLLPNGELLIAGYFADSQLNQQALLYRVDTLGNVLWSQTYGGAGIQEFFDVDVLPNGNIALTGRTSAGLTTDQNLWLVLTDPLGNLLWDQTYGKTGEDIGYAVHGAADDEIYALGAENIGSAADALVVRTDSTGAAFDSQYGGNLYHSLDGDCTRDVGDPNLTNWLVEIPALNAFAITDANGDFLIDVPLGTYTLSFTPPPGPGWSFIPGCPAGDTTITILQPCSVIDTSRFRFKQLNACPAMAIDLTPAFVLRCDTARYFVDYCNDGSLDATPARIEIDLDTTLTFLGTTFSGTFSQMGQTLIFSLGTVAAGDCGSFSFDTFVDCNVQLGSAQCAVARIFPDTICADTTGWDGSELGGNIDCLPTDSVRFTLENLGTGTMLAPGGVSVVEDNIMRFADPNILLNGGQADTLVTFPANGETWIMKVYNSPGHPVIQEYAIFIEGCGADSAQSASTGYATGISPQNDSATVSVDCRLGVDTLARLAKAAIPVGLGPLHIVELVDEVEYSIRYINQGADTVAKINILDTLSSLLDWSTVTTGVASHPYQFSQGPNGVLEWSFPDIDLPPDDDDRFGSVLMLKFRVAIDPDSANLGQTIFNTAWLIENNNLPGRPTNSTFHQLGPILTGIWEQKPHPLAKIIAYPNPFSERVNFALGGQYYSELRLELYGLDGRRLRVVDSRDGYALTLYRAGLAPGVYAFRITAEGRPIGRGKVMVRADR